MGKSQTEDVLKHIKQKGYISSFEAFNLYGATRLSSIIFALRKKGIPITTELKNVKNRYGDT